MTFFFYFLLNCICCETRKHFIAEHNWLTAVQYCSFLILHLTFCTALLKGKKDQITFKSRLKCSLI
jgi:hypothetical protein